MCGYQLHTHIHIHIPTPTCTHTHTYVQSHLMLNTREPRIICNGTYAEIQVSTTQLQYSNNYYNRRTVEIVIIGVVEVIGVTEIMIQN